MTSSKGLLRKSISFTLAVIMVLALVVSVVSAAQAGRMMMPANEARKAVTDRFGGIIQKIEYTYDDTNPLYKGEALKAGSKVVFEINANTRAWAKWDVGNDNSWDSFQSALPSLITMDQAVSSVVAKSGNNDTFVQKIDFLWDDSEPLYQGEAFIRDTKYSFEIKAKGGEFKKWDVSTGDETWAEKYYNVRTVAGDGPVGNAGNSGKNRIELQINNMNMKVNGANKEVDPGRGTAPQIMNGRTILPIRAVVEALGGQVGYEDATKKITITLDGKNVEMWVGNNSILINNSNKAMDVAPIVVNGRTMVPIRFVEDLGFNIKWDQNTKTVTID